MEEQQIEKPESEEQYGRISHKVDHFKISRRDTLVNDFKNSTIEGALSFGFSILSVLILLGGIFLSYRKGGAAGYFVGLVMIMAGLVSLTSVILSAIGWKRKDKVRHYMEKRGFIISLIVLSALTAIFIRGLILFLK